VGRRASRGLRIIGGQWRGRRLPVPAAPGLRPTPERVRETLFNWLQGWLAGARCLDLFAGSGALGLEAASRGAGEVVLVERCVPVARRLREVALELGADQVRVVTDDALRFLQRGDPGRFDLVFLDPPFGSGLLERAFSRLPAVLNDPARVYVESPAGAPLPPMPTGWRVSRHTRAGDVAGCLIEVRNGPTDGADLGAGFR